MGRHELMHRHWRWLMAMIGSSLATSICAQTAEHPEWKIGDKWQYHAKTRLPSRLDAGRVVDATDLSPWLENQ